MTHRMPSCFSACFAYLKGNPSTAAERRYRYKQRQEEKRRKNRKERKNSVQYTEEPTTSTARNTTVRKSNDSINEPRLSDSKDGNTRSSTDAPRKTAWINDAPGYSGKRRSSKDESEPEQERRRSSDRAAQAGRKLDILIFGATGALGSYTVLHAVTVLEGFHWGIAGRSQRNLEAVLRNVAAITNKKCDDVPIFLADANNKEALVKVAQECQLVVNCCGPYEEHAASVIEACIAATTHYVDASMEPCFLKQVRDKFNADAEMEKVYIITSCGFMSFVVDVGINYIEDHFKGTVSSVEAYTQFCRLDSRHFVPLMNCATWQSLIAAMANAKELIADSNRSPTAPPGSCNSCLRSALNVTLPVMPKLCYSSPIARTDVVNGVSIPLPLIDAQAVKVSQQLISKLEQKPEVQFKSYLTFPTYFIAFLALIWCVVLFVLAQAPGTRELMLRYPRIFSLGMCSSQCIDKEAVDQLLFSVTFKATGCPARRMSSPSQTGVVVHGPSPHCNIVSAPKSLDQIEKSLKVKICALNPFYGIGCVALLSSAITVLKQTKDLPGKGGVLTPGAAFRKTQILQEVSKHNPRFKYKVL